MSITTARATRVSAPEPYTREEIIEEQFGEYLKGLVLDEEVIDWVAEALRQSHEDEKRFHDEAVTRLRAEYDKYQVRLDKLYEDKVDGGGGEFFKRKSAEWGAEQTQLRRLKFSWFG
jgi:site-specific DNA recombinase